MDQVAKMMLMTIVVSRRQEYRKIKYYDFWKNPTILCDSPQSLQFLID
jgi:hypothetical protein